MVNSGTSAATSADAGAARDVRLRARRGDLITGTSGLAMGRLQANLVTVPRDVAWDFLLFCHRNPQPCPVIEVVDAGSTEPRDTAPGADLRTDLPRYCVYEHGKLVSEPFDVREWWRPDFVSFLLGCSFSFEEAMLAAGLPVRHIEEGHVVPMYRTSIACRAAGVFVGPLVVSMQPLSVADVPRAAEITSRYPLAHGGPVHVGRPDIIGIAAIDRPDYGAPVAVHDEETPVFWACGVTPQVALGLARLPIAITHYPGHMLVTDRAADDSVYRSLK